MAAEINSKYKKFRSSALLATVRARTFVCLVFTDFWILSVILTCIDVFCKQSLCFCERVCDAPLFLGAFWDLNHTSCVSVVAILCYWRSFLKALYEHGSLFIVLLLRMSEFRCRKSVPCTICVFLWKVERRIALFLFLISDEFLSPSYNSFHPVIPLLCSRWLLSSDDAYWNKLCVVSYDLPCFDRVWFLETLICISCNTVCLFATFSSRKVGRCFGTHLNSSLSTSDLFSRTCTPCDLRIVMNICSWAGVAAELLEGAFCHTERRGDDARFPGFQAWPRRETWGNRLFPSKPRDSLFIFSIDILGDSCPGRPIALTLHQA